MLNSKTPMQSAPLLLPSVFFGFLIDKGADVNARNNNGMGPLKYAATALSLNRNTVEHLLQKGADVNAKDEMGISPLGYALSSRYLVDEEELVRIRKEHKEIIDLLRKHGAKE
jgi:ankyrin repeat protein